MGTAIHEIAESHVIAGMNYYPEFEMKKMDNPLALVIIFYYNIPAGYFGLESKPNRRIRKWENINGMTVCRLELN